MPAYHSFPFSQKPNETPAYHGMPVGFMGVGPYGAVSPKTLA
jgi:hypothetical protein